ncbi:Nicotinamide mononucleotide transporter OS=Streptomyces glaucescens OX=1907 GN=SGLAU_05810 PE=3 SV=1 [Streptomyces glaucescens]
MSLIPTTLALTTLGIKQPGDPVNLEVDVIAKYVERLLGTRGPRSELVNSEAFTLFGQRILWSDMVGNIFGLAALALGWRRLRGPGRAAPRRHPLRGLLRPPHRQRRQAGRRDGRRPLGLVAVNRGKGRSDDGQISVRFATWGERAAMLGAAALGTVAVALFFKANPTLSWDPWPDAYIFVGTIVAMYAQARGMVEFWFAWLLVDLVGVPLNCQRLRLLRLRLRHLRRARPAGLRDWWLRSRRSGQPVLEGAPA